MKKTYDLSTTAEAFDRGVLASRLAALASRPPGYRLTEKERFDASAGADLIAEIMSGVQGLSSRQNVTDSSARGIRSLGLAMSPLQRLAEIATSGQQPENLMALLDGIQQMLKRLAAESGSLCEDRNLLLTRHFFEFLADSLLASLGRIRMAKERPPSI